MFSLRLLVRSKASERRFSHLKQVLTTQPADQQAQAYLLYFNILGTTKMRHLRVAALAKGVAIGCAPRLDLTHFGCPEHDL